jgi:hypothetical protein
MSSLILVNPDGVDLCKYCIVGFCTKAAHYHKNYPEEKMTIYPSYTGDQKWWFNNVKEVSEEDFKPGGEGFHKAKRIGRYAEAAHD